MVARICKEVFAAVAKHHRTLGPAVQTALADRRSGQIDRFRVGHCMKIDSVPFRAVKIASAVVVDEEGAVDALTESSGDLLVRTLGLRRFKDEMPVSVRRCTHIEFALVVDDLGRITADYVGQFARKSEICPVNKVIGAPAVQIMGHFPH